MNYLKDLYRRYLIFTAYLLLGSLVSIFLCIPNVNQTILVRVLLFMAIGLILVGLISYIYLSILDRKLMRLSNIIQGKSDVTVGSLDDGIIPNSLRKLLHERSQKTRSSQF